MRRSHKRLVALLAAMPLLLFTIAALYQQGMNHLEGEPHTFTESVEWASETFTSTGYGRDNEWTHPVMVSFVVFVQFLGISFLFLVFPLVLLPFFEERFQGRLPSSLPPLREYVLIYRWGPAVVHLIEELEAADVPVVVFEEDEAVARRLHDRRRHVVFGQLQDEGVDLERIHAARGVVANGDDDSNAAFALIVRQQGYQGPVVALISNPARRNPMRRIGASAVFTPRHVLAATIAAKASAKISPRLSGVQILGDSLEVAELRIHANSSLAGKTLAEAHVRARTGATIIGQWVGGELVTDLRPDTRLEVGTIAIAVGSQESITGLSELVGALAHGGHFVVVGHNEVGSRTARFLRDADEEVRVVHDRADPEVDLVGDPLDPDLLSAADVTSAQAVILTLEDDNATLFASAVVRDLAPDIPLIVGVDLPKNVARIHRAGADFALSVGQVAGQLIAFQLLGQESVSVQPELKLVKARAGALAGKSLREVRVRERAGCLVVAFEHDGALVVDFDSHFVPDAQDSLYICGTSHNIAEFHKLFPDPHLAGDAA